MNKFSLFVFFLLLLVFVGCNQKTGTPTPLVIDTNTQQVDNTDMKPRIIELKGLKNKPLTNGIFYSEIITIDRVTIKNGNLVDIYVTNISTEDISYVFIDKVELRPIKDGKPVKVRSNKIIKFIDASSNKLTDADYGDELYPGETAVIKYTMPSSVASCDDYAIFSDYFGTSGVYRLDTKVVKLSYFVDCSNLK